VDGDEEPLCIEAVHLDETILVRRSSVGDDEDEVVVVLDLRALAEVLGILHCERVKLEGLPQDLEVLSLGLIEVKPEELSASEQFLDCLAAELDLRAAALVDDQADPAGSLRAHWRFMLEHAGDPASRWASPSARSSSR